MKKLLLSFFLVFFILNTGVLAQDFSISIDKKDQYLAGYTDYVTVTINNPKPEDWFTVSLFGSEKWIYADVPSGLIKIPSMGSGSIRIVVEPPRDILPPNNPYNYILKVTRVGGDELEKGLLITVAQTTNAIIKNLKLSCTECLDEVIVSGTVYNVGSKPLDLSLILNVGEQQKTVSLGKIDLRDQKEFESTFSLKDMKPGDYVLELKLVDTVGKVLYTESAQFKIPTFENIIYDKKTSSTPFGSMVTVTATNMGNIDSFADLKSATPNAWYSIYTGPSPTGMLVGDYYSWRIKLEPEQTKSITYSEVYWPSYAVIIIIVLAVILFYWQSTAFTFTKNVMSGKRIKSGKEISVSLNLKNKKKEIDKAIVRDIIPSNFAITSKFDTIKPVIKKIPEGVELDWKVGNLKPGEERVFHYTIKPVNVADKTKLPSAIAKASRNKKIMSRSSNKIHLHPEEEKTKYVTVKVDTKQ